MINWYLFWAAAAALYLVMAGVLAVIDQCVSNTMRKPREEPKREEAKKWKQKREK